MENLDKKIIITDETGKKVEGTIVFTFEANGENFVIYELGNNSHASKIDQEGNLRPIEEDEWKYVENIYNEYIETQEEEDE